MISPQKITSAFINTGLWIFDIDNTLYPRATNLFTQIDHNMTHFIMDLLNMDAVNAKALQKEYYRNYGTTLRGLMEIHGIAPDAFLQAAHNIDYSVISPNPVLVAQIAALPGRKIVLTNGSCQHGEHVLKALGFTNEFSAIYDIALANYMPKPHGAIYDQLMQAEEGFSPQQMAIFEDLPRNLVYPAHCGMVTIFLDEGEAQGGREGWELDKQDSLNHIDFIISDLSDFLGKILQNLNS